MSVSATGERASSRRASATRFLFLVLVWFLIELPDPLGLTSAVKQAAGELFQMVAGPLHGFGDDRPNERIAVVEVSDESVRRSGGWPLDRSAYIAWLDTVLEQRPLAVLVDIRFMERLGRAGAAVAPASDPISDDSVRRLADLAVNASGQGIPVLFSRGGVDWLPLPAALQPFSVVTGWSGPHDHLYPLQVVSEPAGSPPHRRCDAARRRAGAALRRIRTLCPALRCGPAGGLLRRRPGRWRVPQAGGAALAPVSRSEAVPPQCRMRRARRPVG
jgi:hypothetical protein